MGSQSFEGQPGLVEKDSGQLRLDRLTLRRAQALVETNGLAQEVGPTVRIWQGRVDTFKSIGNLFALDAETADCF